MDSTEPTLSIEHESLTLDAKQGRIIAALMEKQLTTPNAYPLTLNNLMLACNQKSNREPVMQMTEGEIGHICNLMNQSGMIRIESGERSKKYEQLFSKQLKLDRGQQSLLTVMMLRTPQTLNDLKRRTERMQDFEDTDEIQLVLMDMLEADQPLIQHLPKGPGQREDRYHHTFGEWQPVSVAPLTDTKAETTPVSSATVAPTAADGLLDRIAELEARISKLEAAQTSSSDQQESVE